jgi:hypothetical protein
MPSPDYDDDFDSALDVELELQALADDADKNDHAAHNQTRANALSTDIDDEFDLDEDDELELQALADDTDKRERKHARNESGVIGGPPTKALKTGNETANSVALGVAIDVLENRFKLPGFHLKQALAIDRIRSGGSSVVVFPTGEIFSPRLPLLTIIH